MTGPTDRHQLQQIIDGLSEGVILIETDQTITYANEAALALHGVRRLEDLGCDVTAYRKNFVPHYRNHHLPGAAHSPVERVVAGEAFRDVVVEVAPAGAEKPEWVHRIRSLVINDAQGLPDCLVLIIHDETERYEAEERFERAFAANPAPAAICRLADLRFARVNEGFCQFTGYAQEDVVGRSIYEVDVLRKTRPSAPRRSATRCGAPRLRSRTSAATSAALARRTRPGRHHASRSKPARTQTVGAEGSSRANSALT